MEIENVSGVSPEPAATDTLAVGLDAVADIIVLCDSDGIILSCNRAAESFFGISRQGLAGTAMHRWSAAVHFGEEADDPVLNEACSTVGMEVLGRDWRYVLDNGRTGILELTARRLQEKTAAPRILLSLRDNPARHSEQQILYWQAGILRRLAHGNTASSMLNALVFEFEQEYHGWQASVMRLDEVDRLLHCLAAPSLPASLVNIIDGTPAASDGPPGALAAWSGKRVTISDMLGGGGERQLPEPFVAAGIAGTLSEPLRNNQGTVIGVCEFYHRLGGGVTRPRPNVIAAVVELAGLVIEQSMALIRAEASEERFRRLVMGMENMSVQGYDAQRRVILWNRGSELLYGYSEAEALGRPLEELIIPPAMREGVIEKVRRWVDNDELIPPGELALMHKDGRVVHVYSTHEMQRLPTRGTEMYCVDIDLSERKKSEQMIWYQANYDLLTGLANRRLFIEHLGQQLMIAIDTGKPLALFYMDLDDFKQVNDRLGHDAGDRLLIEASRRMQGCVRQTDVLARLGGDEFALVLPDFTDRTALGGLAVALKNAVAEPYVLGGEEVTVAVSIGIAICPHQAHSMDELIRHADAAMYAAKRRGKNNFTFYRPQRPDDYVPTDSRPTRKDDPLP